ncbi:MAG: serine/threonine-protein kinase [Coleofasciculus sp. G1-WW12-02]|uniref:serine/threonine protein kinase n=1 Tax=Coleofasciculus sp. G1-WW12-02 TaxID=3068483 RepID=UPI0032FA040B
MFNPEQQLKERYQLKQRLGRTAAGRQTWLAMDVQFNEQVTVKLLAFSPEMQWDELKLFEREAQVLQSLEHPRIPRYRDYFSLDREMGSGIPWFGLVQDYIPGASLQELLDNGKRFSEKQVRSIANQIIDILIYLHELSPPVLHRDIKPSNLILGKNKQVYLIDFGAVQAQAAVTGVTFTVVGTSGYAPLEQFWGRAVAASDLYALGATLIHLLTGIAPADLPQKEGRIYFRDRLSLKSNFIPWIEQMTEILLEKRFSTAKQAMESLRYGLIQQSTSTSLPVRGRLSKPSGSLIQLKANKDKLGITIPSPGLRKLTQYNWLLALIVVCFYLGLAWTLIDLLFISKELLINVLPILLPLIGIASLWIHHLGTKTHVFFDRNRNSLEIERQVLFFKYGYQRLDITDIGNAFLMGRGSTYEIRIPSANYIYKLGGALGEKESTWLLQEILTWLYFK